MARLHFHFESSKGKRWTRELKLPGTFKLGTPGATRLAKTRIYTTVLRESKRKPKPETFYVVLEVDGQWRTIHPKADIGRIIPQ